MVKRGVMVALSCIFPQPMIFPLPHNGDVLLLEPLCRLEREDCSPVSVTSLPMVTTESSGLLAVAWSSSTGIESVELFQPGDGKRIRELEVGVLQETAQLYGLPDMSDDGIGELAVVVDSTGAADEFGVRVIVLETTDESPIIWSRTLDYTEGQVRSGVCGDLDLDGIPDIGVASVDTEWRSQSGADHYNPIIVLSGRTGKTLLTIACSLGGAGWAIGEVPDLDGDRIPEVAVGVPWYSNDSDSTKSQGRCALFSGADGGLLLTVDAISSGLTFLPGTPDQFAYSITGGWDLTGSGAANWVLSIHGWSGKVMIYEGAPKDGSPVAICASPDDQYGFGSSLAIARPRGSEPLLLVGHPDSDLEAHDAGAVYCYDVRQSRFVAVAPASDAFAGLGIGLVALDAAEGLPAALPQPLFAAWGTSCVEVFPGP